MQVMKYTFLALKRSQGWLMVFLFLPEFWTNSDSKVFLVQLHATADE